LTFPKASTETAVFGVPTTLFNISFIREKSQNLKLSIFLSLGYNLMFYVENFKVKQFRKSINVENIIDW